jgi:hypothetical protein
MHTCVMSLIMTHMSHVSYTDCGLCTHARTSTHTHLCLAAARLQVGVDAHVLQARPPVGVESQPCQRYVCVCVYVCVGGGERVSVSVCSLSEFEKNTQYGT